MSEAVFIFSLDCEGKWGMADSLTPHHQEVITNKSLISAYADILLVLKTYDVKSTFAFVSALTMSFSEYQSLSKFFQRKEFNGNDWLAHFKSDIASNNQDGWFCPELLDMVKTEGHEIASHGFTHLPYIESQVSRTDASLEIEGIKAWRKLKALEKSTFVYPRNLVGYTDILSPEIKGFRAKTPYKKKFLPSFLSSFLEELNIFRRPQKLEKGSTIPGGFFLNWRYGKRALIPQCITIIRWKRMIDRACKNGGVVHLWSHPHNFIDGDGQINLLQQIMAHVAHRKAQGKLRVLTQEEYVEQNHE